MRVSLLSAGDAGTNQGDIDYPYGMGHLAREDARQWADENSVDVQPRVANKPTAGELQRTQIEADRRCVEALRVRMPWER